MYDSGGEKGEQALAFGAFKLYRDQRVLVENGQCVRLGGRAMDILIALVDRAGEIVTKRDLLSLAWPHAFVDEANLRIHIAALRKVLGDGQDGARYIVNVSGHGYVFRLPVRLDAGGDFGGGMAPQSGLPPRSLNRVVGRDVTVDGLLAQLRGRRLITVVGPAGVGKSTVALAVIERGLPEAADGVFFVELSAVEDPALATAAIATALGVSVMTDDATASLAAFLHSRRVVIVLDNCEHVIEVVAPLVESLLRASAQVRFLATSREPLLVPGEWVYRLAPLEVPDEQEAMTPALALSYPSVQLFMERAMNSSETFVLGEAETSTVAEICRSVDGLPLAIELAAARVDLFGLRGLASALGDRLMLVARRSRSGQRRQQSIRGALDWSYDLLSDSERLILARFSVFRASFTLESAIKVAAGEGIVVEDVLDGIASLTAKSLVATDPSGPVMLYRLLRVTRAYASDKLLERGETAALARRHAEHYHQLLVGAEERWDVLARADWIAEYGYAIDDVRAAMEWAFAPGGDIAIGSGLTLASLPFGFQLSLIDEFKRRAELALQQLATLETPNIVAEVRLSAALATLDLNWSVDPVSMAAVFERAVAAAERVTAPKHNIQLLLARAIYRVDLGDNIGAVAFVERLAQSAAQANDPLAILLADRVKAQVLHHAGDHERCWRLADAVMRHPAKSIPLTYMQTSVDRQVSMRMLKARTLWLRGLADQAAELTHEFMEMAAADGPFAQCYSLGAGACPVTLWRGDAVLARRYVDDLLDATRRYTLERWERLGEGYAAALDRLRLDSQDPRLGQIGIDVRPASQMQRELLASVDGALMDAEISRRALAQECGWCNPEMLRLTGELQRAAGDAIGAQALFQSAMVGAKVQGALAWELRVTMSLARLWQERGRSVEARSVLGGVLDRFTEGFATTDLRAAVSLLKSL